MGCADIGPRNLRSTVCVRSNRRIFHRADIRAEVAFPTRYHGGRETVADEIHRGAGHVH